MRQSTHRPWLAAVAAVSLVAGGVTAVTVGSAQAAAGCQVSYTVTSQWQGGFGAAVSVTNLGSAVSSWQLTWAFGAGQTITQLWNGSYTQSGANVTVTNASYNGSIGTGASASFGFNGAWNNSSNPVPTNFALNGTACTGSVASSSPSPTASSTPSSSPTTSASPSPTGTGSGGTLPSSFKWSSSGVILSPQSNSTHSLIAVKDPSVVFYNGTWYVYVSTVDSSGNYNMAAISFTNWSQASSAPLYYLDQSAIGTGYKTAPMLFYFAPQKLWYLSYQTGGNIAYSTNANIANPAGWSAPQNFYAAGEPSIISQNIGSGFWVDSWMICDTANCYLFSMDDNGHLYRSTTPLADFPNGFTNSDTVIAASNTTPDNFFEADNVYKVDGSNQYLLIVEAIGSNGRRYFTSYTASSLQGTWSPLANTQSDPFAAASNVTFSGTAWTQDISSGEAVRSGYDQTDTISPCNLQYVYQGHDPSSTVSYNLLPWRIGMLTQTNPGC
ncbi:MAG TPA: non-reducing end alpha-L-arabinofuranosidase family hydrolase [Actinocrinis sp.]